MAVEDHRKLDVLAPTGSVLEREVGATYRLIFLIDRPTIDLKGNVCVFPTLDDTAVSNVLSNVTFAEHQ